MLKLQRVLQVSYPQLSRKIEFLFYVVSSRKEKKEENFKTHMILT